MNLTQALIALLAAECVLVIIAALAGWMIQPFVLLYWTTLLIKNARDYTRERSKENDNP